MASKMYVLLSKVQTRLDSMETELLIETATRRDRRAVVEIMAVLRDEIKRIRKTGQIRRPAPIPEKPEPRYDD